MRQRILVVDDEKMIRDMLEKAFSRKGYSIVTAESGEEALGILEKEDIPVIFLDLKLPGINGMEVCRKIREEKPMVIVFAVTGYASQYECSDCLSVGFDDYFTKPVDLKTLFKSAEDAFERIDRWTNDGNNK